MTQLAMKNVARKTAGYTIDQTILIVAVIAILITLIIASVGWDILNKTSGTKLASNFRQIEDVNGGFYARMGVWPHIAVAVGNVAACVAAVPTASIAVLATNTCLDAAQQAKFKNMLPSLTIGAAGPPATIQHGFGSNGLITQAVTAGGAGCPGAATDSYLAISFAGVPMTETLEADEALDGGDLGVTGRLRYVAAVNGVTTVTYCANTL